MSPKYRVGDIISFFKGTPPSEYLVIGIKAQRYVILVLKPAFLEHTELQQIIFDIDVIDSLELFKRKATRAEMVLYVP